jgi:2-C-methyl-D-erythritol 4-phosphate cytidylyltransferase
MKNVAVILAGGSGKRINSHLPKQYLPVGDCPLLVHTIRIFELSSIIHDILLVVPKEDIPRVESLIVEPNGFSKIGRIVAGGHERQDSVKNGLDAVGDDTDIVLIHDGVRPFITEELIRLTVREAFNHGAATVGVPVKETVKRVDQAGWILETLDRQVIWLTQTPQAFQRSIIQEAYQRAYRDHFYGTDDASLVERMGHPVRMIKATYDNIKITTQEDLLLAELLIKKRKATVP